MKKFDPPVLCVFLDLSEDSLLFSVQNVYNQLLISWILFTWRTNVLEVYTSKNKKRKEKKKEQKFPLQSDVFPDALQQGIGILELIYPALK